MESDPAVLQPGYAVAPRECLAGLLLVDDAIQAGIESKQTTLGAVEGLAVPFEMRLKRNIANFRLSYAATDHVDIDVNVRNTTKEGSQPWAGTFGFSNAVELAARSTPARPTSVRRSSGRTRADSVRVGYGRVVLQQQHRHARLG
jgi:hypothetical protein